MPSLSIIIPTHNRADILAQCLAYLEKQTIADQLEVIVINDVQDEKFTALSAKTDWQIPIHFETIAPCQQGVARNHGVQRAQASTVLFIGDDIFLKEDACETHLQIHQSAIGNRQSAMVVLGNTEWDPSMQITKVMQWLTQSGWQFGYPQIEKYAGGVLPNSIQHQFTYTSHISVPREVAVRTPFRADMNLYGWEDIEWGMRLRDYGVQVYFEPNAIGYHHHRITTDDSLKRMETLGESAILFSRAVPDFDRLPRGWKKIAYQIFAMFPTMAGKHRAAFLKGIKHASML